MTPTPTSPAARGANQWLRPAIVLLAAFLLLACFATEVTDSDTFWHLETGKYIVQHHRLPNPDPFSFTSYLGTPRPGETQVREFNLTHEWLFQVVLYLLYSAGGFGAVVLFRALLMTAYCSLTALWVWRRSSSFYATLAATAVTAFIASYFASDRPYQITYVLIAATLVILESRCRMWLLPPLFLLWANCHGGFFMGFVVLGTFCAGSLWHRFRGKPEPGERQLWQVAAACGAAAFLNPNGFLAFFVIQAYSQSPLTASLYEWQKPPIWPPTFLTLMLLAAAAVLVWQRRRARIADWLLLALFGAAYFSAVRNSNLAGLVAPALLAAYLPWKRILPRSADWVAALLFALAIAVPFARGRAFQLHSAEWKYPAGAAEFLLAHHIDRPMFNTFDKGGYLLWRCWPQQRTFIDGRCLNESVFADYQRMTRYSPGTRELLDRYGIQVVVMNAFEANSGSIYVLPLALADPAEKEWKLVFADSGAAVFLRHPPPGVQPLPSTAIFSAMEAQCQATLLHDPGRPRCARSLAYLFRNARDPQRARRWMDLYLEHRTDRNPADDAFLQ